MSSCRPCDPWKEICVDVAFQPAVTDPPEEAVPAMLVFQIPDPCCLVDNCKMIKSIIFTALVEMVSVNPDLFVDQPHLTNYNCCCQFDGATFFYGEKIGAYALEGDTAALEAFLGEEANSEICLEPPFHNVC